MPPRGPIRRTAAALLLGALAGLAGCGENGAVIAGRPDGPYRLILELDPAAPEPGERTRLSFRLTHADSGEPVRDLQVVHKRIMHNFIVSRDFRHFAHIHHEDFRPLATDARARATFHFPYTFPQAGRYRVVSEFTHRDRSWIKHFDLAIGDGAAREPAADPARDKRFGPYRARLSVSPDPPVAGYPAEMVLHLERDGEPVTDLGMHLGSEAHGALWRLDGRHFGHMHSHTPRMAALMADARRTAHADSGGTRMARLMQAPREQVYHGPRIPVRHVFPAPGTYRVFLQCAPAGTPRTFDFTVTVREHRPGLDITVDSMVEPAADPE